MTLDFSILGEVSVSMEGYVNDFLAEYEVTGVASSPATDHLYNVDPNGALR